MVPAPLLSTFVIRMDDVHWGRFYNFWFGLGKLLEGNKCLLVIIACCNSNVTSAAMRWNGKWFCLATFHLIFLITGVTITLSTVEAKPISLSWSFLLSGLPGKTVSIITPRQWMLPWLNKSPKKICNRYIAPSQEFSWMSRQNTQKMQGLKFIVQLIFFFV
jgi:hypothetical protein